MSKSSGAAPFAGPNTYLKWDLFTSSYVVLCVALSLTCARSAHRNQHWLIQQIARLYVWSEDLFAIGAMCGRGWFVFRPALEILDAIRRVRDGTGILVYIFPFAGS